MTKRIFILVIMSFMLVTTVTACGGNGDSLSGGNSDSLSSGNGTAQTTESNNGSDSGGSPIPSEPSESNNGSDNGGNPISSQPSESNNVTAPQVRETSYSLSNIVIEDNENCTFTISSVEDNGFWGLTLKVFCENKTDFDLMFSWGNVSVNGYMIDPFWAIEIAAGEKSNDEISFTDWALDRCSIYSADEIVFTLNVYDSNDWLSGWRVRNDSVVYPTGLDANSIKYPARVSTASEQIIVDIESCSFIISSVDTDGLLGYTLTCYLENKSLTPLMFSWDNVSVNGFMVNALLATIVQPGKCSYSDIYILNSKLEENGISNVEEIEFKLTIYDSDNWSAPDVVSETFIYKP